MAANTATRNVASRNVNVLPTRELDNKIEEGGCGTTAEGFGVRVANVSLLLLPHCSCVGFSSPTSHGYVYILYIEIIIGDELFDDFCRPCVIQSIYIRYLYVLWGGRTLIHVDSIIIYAGRQPAKFSSILHLCLDNTTNPCSGGGEITMNTRCSFITLFTAVLLLIILRS